MSIDEGTLIHGIVGFIGGTIRWLLYNKGMTYKEFMSSDNEQRTNLKLGYAVFFVLLLSFTIIWYLAFKPGK